MSGYQVSWFAFQAFPRQQKRFRLRLYDRQQRLVGKLMVSNPAPRRPEAWRVELLPATRRDGHLAFTLNDLSIRTNANATGEDSIELQPPPLIAPAFEIREEENPTKAWEPVQTDLLDCSGNRASRWFFKSPYLCPFESAWKLRVKFCGNETSRFASNTCWTLDALSLPAPGSFTALSATHQLQGVSVCFIALAGTGHVTYSNNVPVRAETLDGLEKDDYSETSMGTGSGGAWVTVNTVQTPTPHVALSVSGLRDDERISVHATDDKGRRFYAKVWEWDFPSNGYRKSESPYLRRPYTTLSFLGLDVPADARKVTLTFCVHELRTVEFVVQPPGHSRP